MDGELGFCAHVGAWALGTLTRAFACATSTSGIEPGRPPRDAAGVLEVTYISTASFGLSADELLRLLEAALVLEVHGVLQVHLGQFLLFDVRQRDAR